MTTQTENSIAGLASRFINHTDKHIFLTGKAGTGKTTFLKHIIHHTHKKAVIVAPTGIAAINAGGTTIHSLFQLPFGSFIPVNGQTNGMQANIKLNDPFSVIKNLQMYQNKRNLLRELELLIIDEVSMLRADLLDAIDIVLKHVRRNNIPFGGVQILFIGDLLQLPPVVKEEEWKYLKSFYNSAYFFDAKALLQDKPLYLELDKVYRQSDENFINLLNNFRHNEITGEDIELLNNHFKPDFKPGKEENFITLTTHNYKADQINKVHLQELKEKSYFFEATLEGDFNEFAYPVEKTLELKTGAQVMFIKNDPTGEQRFFNGKIGVVANISEKGIEVLIDNSKTIIVEKYTWENVKYALNPSTNEIEEKISGTFSHYPLKLAWAITVHKSQGLTFEKAILDIGDAFAPGQVYVALSRLKSLAGLVLTSKINFKGIRKDEKIAEYAHSQTKPENLHEVITKETEEFLKKYLLRCFDLGRISGSLKEHVESYIQGEKTTFRQKNHSWAMELKAELEEVKLQSDKFLNQIKQIFHNQEESYITQLNTRVQAAKEYFSPIFRKLSKQVFDQIEVAKTQPRTKTYLTELMELEALFYEQLKLISKAGALSQSLIDKKEFTSAEVKKIVENESRVEQIRQVLSQSGIPVKKERKPKTNKEKVKKGKPEEGASRKETLELYQQGKTIAEISQIRAMALTTIEGHLAQCVAKGILEVSRFISSEKTEEIIATSKSLKTFSLGPIKQALGNDYSYGDIRFAMAFYMSSMEEKIENA